jgi:hypothetical protein
MLMATTSMQISFKKLFMRSLEKSLDKHSHQRHRSQHAAEDDDYHILFQHANIYEFLKAVKNLDNRLKLC